LVAILVPVFSAHFAVAAGIVAEESAAAEADVRTVAEAAATVAAVVTADVEDLSAGPAGAAAAADSIAAAVDVPATAIPVDTRGAHN
jgi:hypothetical protein